MTATAQPLTTVPATPPVRAAAPPLDDLAGLLPDWRRHLRATNKAPTTVASCLRCAENLLAFLTDRGMPTTATGINRAHLEAFLGDLLERVSAATAAKHYRSLQQLWKWLEEDGEFPASPMRNMKPPHVPEQPVLVPSR
jgi:site-specific recombinase XerD